MGDSPGGLGKEGRFEERVWSSLVEQWQEVYCRTPITEVFTYILASKEGPTRGRIPKSWTVHFPSCFTQTDKERVEIQQQKALSDAQYIQLGVLNPLEVRESRFAGTKYSIETKLNEAITEQLVATTDAQFQSQMSGYEAQLQAAQAPPGAPAEGAPLKAPPPKPSSPPRAKKRPRPAATRSTPTPRACASASPPTTATPSLARSSAPTANASTPAPPPHSC
jgi:hypothetical protein